jgi:predicted DNA-binding transcriptional regulator AlpA
MLNINQSPIEARGNATPENRMIRINELASHKGQRGLIPVSRATVWRWVAEGRFPQPVRLSERVTAWNSQTVAAWIEAQASGKGAA